MGQTEAHCGQRALRQLLRQKQVWNVCAMLLSQQVPEEDLLGDNGAQTEDITCTLYITFSRPSVCLTWFDKPIYLYKNRLNKFIPLRQTPEHRLCEGSTSQPDKGMGLRYEELKPRPASKERDERNQGGHNVRKLAETRVVSSETVLELIQATIHLTGEKAFVGQRGGRQVLPPALISVQWTEVRNSDTYRHRIRCRDLSFWNVEF